MHISRLSSAAETSSTELPEAEQKDIQVRLQELFRDKKNILEGGLRSIEASKVLGQFRRCGAAGPIFFIF